jgi:hypothetical protein
MMTFDEYKEHVAEFANYKRYEYPFYPLALLVEETDELCVHIRKGSSVGLIWSECGDTLWALTALECELGGLFLEPLRECWFMRNIAFSNMTYSYTFWNEAEKRAGYLNSLSCQVIGKLHKMMRGDSGVTLVGSKELNDLVTQFVKIVKLFPVTFSEIAMMNRDKLVDRRARNMLQGNGDNR